MPTDIETADVALVARIFDLTGRLEGAEGNPANLKRLAEEMAIITQAVSALGAIHQRRLLVAPSIQDADLDFIDAILANDTRTTAEVVAMCFRAVRRLRDRRAL